MKISLGKLVDSVSSFNKLFNSDLVLSDAYRLYKMSAEMQRELDFFNMKRQEILNKYQDKTDGEDEQSKMERANMTKEFDDLCSVEVELKDAPLSISCSNSAHISASDIKKLSEYIDFKIA